MLIHSCPDSLLSTGLPWVARSKQLSRRSPNSPVCSLFHFFLRCSCSRNFCPGKRNPLCLAPARERGGYTTVSGLQGFRRPLQGRCRRHGSKRHGGCKLRRLLYRWSSPTIQVSAGRVFENEMLDGLSGAPSACVRAVRDAVE